MRILFPIAALVTLSFAGIAGGAHAQVARPNAKPTVVQLPAAPTHHEGLHDTASASTPDSRAAGGALVGGLLGSVLSLGVGGIAFAGTGDDIWMVVTPGLATIVLTPLGASLGVLVASRGQRFYRTPVFAQSYAFTVLSTLTTMGLAMPFTFAMGEPLAGPLLGLMATGVLNTIVAPCAAYGGYGRGKRRFLKEQARAGARLSLVPHVGTLARERSYGLALRYTF